MQQIKRHRRGFTLIESLVTIAVIGVLAAVTIPAITRQISAAEPSRVQQDLDAVRKGIELYTANSRPYYPGDIDDLVNLPGASDTDLTGTASGTKVTATSWKGPYLERTIADIGTVTSGTAFLSGFASSISQNLRLCSAVSSTSISSCVSGTDYVGVEVTGITLDQFLLVNSLVDGAADTAASSTAGLIGRFRYNTLSSTATYLAIGYVSG